MGKSLKSGLYSVGLGIGIGFLFVGVGIAHTRRITSPWIASIIILHNYNYTIIFVLEKYRPKTSRLAKEPTTYHHQSTIFSKMFMNSLLTLTIWPCIRAKQLASYRSSDWVIIMCRGGGAAITSKLCIIMHGKWLVQEWTASWEQKIK